MNYGILDTLEPEYDIDEAAKFPTKPGIGIPKWDLHEKNFKLGDKKILQSSAARKWQATIY